MFFIKYNLWGIEFFGGKRECGESSVEVVICELYEEIGVKVKNIYYIV